MSCFSNLEVVLKFWDFFFAFGFHFIPLIVLSLVITKRNEFLKLQKESIISSLTKNINIFFDELEPQKLIELSISFIREFPEDILIKLDKHTHDENFVNEYINS
jgi:cell cycle arrest protein BUB2